MRSTASTASSAWMQPGPSTRGPAASRPEATPQQSAGPDPSFAGVYRALRERVVRPGSPFRSPTLIQNTLFFEFKPNARWTLADWVAWLRLRITLMLRYQANRFRPYMPPWFVRIGWLVERRLVVGEVAR